MKRSISRPTALAGLTLLLSATLAGADFRLERELELAPGGRFELETEGGRITVEGSAEPGAHILVTSSREDVEDRYDLSFEAEPGRVRVTARRKRGDLFGWLSGRGDGLHFEVRIPAQTELELRTSGGRIEIEGIRGDALIRTSGGRIDLSDLEGKVDAHTSGGAIEARDLRGNVGLSTSGGPIAVERVSGDLEAKTSGGSITAREIGGEIVASTSGGSITVSLLPGNGRGGELSTSGGSITAKLDPAVALEIDARTSGGTVSVDLPVTVQGRVSRGALRGELNGGGPLLRLRSSGGSIRVRGL